MSGRDPRAKCWIQRADLSVAVDDAPVDTVEQVMRHYDGFGWAAERAKFRDGEAAGATDVCPPGLGLNRSTDDALLHLLPDGRGRVDAFLPGPPRKRRWFHIFQSFGGHIEVTGVPDTLVRPAVQHFLRGDDAALVTLMQGATP